MEWHYTVASRNPYQLRKNNTSGQTKELMKDNANSQTKEIGITDIR